MSNVRLTAALYALLIVVLPSCNRPAGSTERAVNADSLSKAKADSLQLSIEATTKPAAPSAPVYDGILLGRTSLYADTIPDQEPTGDLDAMTVQIVQKSEFLDPSSETRSCDAYYWYLVKTKDGKSGWVKGYDLYRKASTLSEAWNFNTSILNQEFNVDGKKYFLEGAVGMNMDLSGEDFIGCAVTMMPYLYDSKGLVNLIEYDNSKFGGHLGQTQSNSRGNLELVLTSDGGSADIKQVSESSSGGRGVLVLSLSHSYQDGGETSELTIRKSEDAFTVSGHEFAAKE